MMRVTLLLSMAVVLLMTPAISGPSQAQIDPQSLVGEWAGQWSLRIPAGTVPTGQYSLKIIKVEGDKVHAHLDSEPLRTPRGATPAVNAGIIGTLIGNVLTLGSDELTVDGNEMKGRRTSTLSPSEIKLTKKK